MSLSGSCLAVDVAAGGSEAEVKIAYIFNILKFIHWTPLPGNQLTLCMDENASLASAAGALEDRLVQGYKLRVIGLRENFQVPGQCQVAFIEEKNRVERSRMIQQCHAAGVLTISDAQDFTVEGGIIGFVTVRGGIRFILNLTQARAVGIVVSSQLAETAFEVH